MTSATANQRTPAHRVTDPDHLRELVDGSGISVDVIARARLFTCADPSELAKLTRRPKRTWRGEHLPALVIPSYVPSDPVPVLYNVKPRTPMVVRSTDRTERSLKYVRTTGVSPPPYLPPDLLEGDRLCDATVPKIITEGEKKALAAATHGFACVALSGVDCWGRGKQRSQRKRPHPILEAIAKSGCELFIAYDSDCASNLNVRRAEEQLAHALTLAGATVYVVRIPESPNEEKVGLDDYLVKNGPDAFRALMAHAKGRGPVTTNDERRPVSDLPKVRDAAAYQTAPVPTDLRVPDGYELRPDASVWRVSDDSEPKKVGSRAILVTRLMSEGETATERVEIAFERYGRWQFHTVGRSAIRDARAALKELPRMGAPIDSNTAADVVRWLSALEDTNEQLLPHASAVTRGGWHELDGKDVFVLGAEVLGGGEHPKIVLTRDHDHAGPLRGIARAGDAELQLSRIRYVCEHDRPAATLVFGALAAPLLKLLGARVAPNFIVHLVGESSRGKTTKLQLAAGIYGNPELRGDGWISNWNSTKVGLEHHFARACDLPVCLDECTMASPKDREDAIYMVESGRGKTRGSREGGTRPELQWRCVLLSTGEQELVDATARTGARVRVLQPRSNGFGTLDAAGVDEMKSAALGNYGHVGRRWIEALLSSNREQLARDFAEVCRHFQTHREQTGASNLEARQGNVLSLLFFAERCAETLLHIRTTTETSMLGWLIDPTAERIRVDADHERALELLRELIGAQPAAFPSLKRSCAGELDPSTEPRGEVYGYFDDDELYLLPNQLEAFFARHGLDVKVVTRAWKASGWLSVDRNEKHVRCTRKVRIGKTRPRVYALVRGFIDDRHLTVVRSDALPLDAAGACS